jgi:hypothetical protein
MTDPQNIRERLLDRMDHGELTADDANVALVRAERFRIVYRLPANVRRALNAAVKRGELGHLPKDGLRPEAYFHPTFAYLAKVERDRIEQHAIAALRGVVASGDLL